MFFHISESQPNTERLLFADVDLESANCCTSEGLLTNEGDWRKDIFSLVWKGKGELGP